MPPLSHQGYGQGRFCHWRELSLGSTVGAPSPSPKLAL